MRRTPQSGMQARYVEWVFVLALALQVAGCVAGRPPLGATAVNATPPTPSSPVPPIPPPPPPPAVSFAAGIRLTALMGDKRSATAGFVRQGAGTPIPFVLQLGDVHDGMELLAADVEKGEAVLRQGAEEVLLMLGPAAPVARPSIDPQRSFYADRLRARREQRQQRPTSVAPSPTLTGEALDKYLQNYQMDLIRRGQAPLPIPLTPEMDDQLVREGVLPPSK